MLAGKAENSSSLPSEKPEQLVINPSANYAPVQPVKKLPLESASGETETKQVEKTRKKTVSVNEAMDESKVKGDAFEKFVVLNFDKKYFKIKEWRGDKYVNGTYAESNQYPDLEIRFQLGRHRDLFAVECKWRKNLKNDELEWAKDYQLSNYRQFSKERNVPVFVIIGIGGTPDDPEQLYVVPLEKMNGAIVQLKELQPYLKENKKNFYWDRTKNKLS